MEVARLLMKEVRHTFDDSINFTFDSCNSLNLTEIYPSEYKITLKAIECTLYPVRCHTNTPLDPLAKGDTRKDGLSRVLRYTVRDFPYWYILSTLLEIPEVFILRVYTVEEYYESQNKEFYWKF